MKPFLAQVAEHYFINADISQYCFVFPNRRSLVFFKKYLRELVAESGKPIFEPALYTMNDFFYRISGLNPCDEVYQLLELYASYCTLYEHPESLDEFIFWGGILLSDFNDIDKYLVNPESLFTNVKDFRSIQDSFEYIDENQKEAIEKFVSNFTTGGTFKDEFLKLWNILLPLYSSFNASLLSKGYSYEGQVYRQLASKLGEGSSIIDILPKELQKKIVFVGLNALNECEKTLLRKLHNAKLSEFCWDYSSEWIKDKNNKSSFFLEKNIAEFPQAFKLDAEGLTTPEINVLSIPSSVGQAKQLPQILERINARGLETAIVLPDEKLLLPVLNSIPEYIEDVNVTMGYPISSSALWTLFSDISNLQLHLRLKGDKYHFYHKQLRSIFSNSIIKTIANDEDKALIDSIINEAQYYVSEEKFEKSELLSLIFRPIVKDSSSLKSIPDIIKYQKEIILYIGKRLTICEQMALETDFAREIYLVLNRMESYELEVLPPTYLKLFSQMLARSSVPFKGEPLNGLQIMGPLETRSLDFDNLLILSCNEDVFPRRNSTSSFIPPELRKGFGLPTYEYQDAVWAYYFYRLIQRAKCVWLLYDSRTEGLQSGEESRYIKQLSLHFGAKIRRFVAKDKIKISELNIQTAPPQKTPEMISPFTTGRKALSPSSLYTYLCCPAKFYYSHILELKTVKDVVEALDGSMIGNVYHKTMENLYSHDSLTVAMLKDIIKSNIIEEKVKEYILLELDATEIVGKNLIYKDTISRYVRQTIKRDIELLEENSSFLTMHGHEKEVKIKINGISLKGIVDRIDSVEDGVIRIIDYKTGNSDYEFDLNAILNPEIAEKVFGKDNSERDKVALQLYLYEKMLRHGFKDTRFELSIYHPRRLFTQKIESVSIPEDTLNAMDAKLVETFNSLTDLSLPFERSEDEIPCTYCEFKIICGR